MTVDLYNFPGSGPCRAVLLTAKALGLELNVKNVDLRKKEQLEPWFLKINPQHTVPTVVDNGFVVWESNAIITYLVTQYGKNDSLYPKDPKKRALVDQRLYFNMGTLAARFNDYFFPVLFGTGGPDPAKFAKLEEALKLLDTFLEGQDYVAGSALTVADLALVPTIANVVVTKVDLTLYKNIAKWYAKVQTAVPGYEEINDIDTLTKMFEKWQKK